LDKGLQHRLAQSKAARPIIPLQGQPARVGICIPSGDMVHADFMLALASMCNNPGAGIALISCKGSLIVVNRNNGVKFSIDLNCTHLLFLDSDMVFPQDTLRRLLAHNKDIVGAAYTKRVPPHDVLGRTLDNKPLEVNTGCIEVRGLPTGCMLINMNVFKRLKRPYFREVFVEEGGTDAEGVIGEDYYFCDAARAAGCSVWMDVDLSKEIGHIGQMVYRIGDQFNQAGVEAAKQRIAQEQSSVAA